MNKNVMRAATSWGVALSLFGGSVALSLVLVQPSRLPELWRQPADIGTLAIAMTPVILTGGIDLSVGSIVAVSGIVLGLLYRDAGWPIWFAAMGGVACGALAGAINGLLVAMGIAPLVVTLATMALYAGIAMALVQGNSVKNLPDSFCWIGQDSLWGLPYQVWILLAVSILFTLFVHQTWMGRCLFAIGENRLAARFAAVPVRRLEALLYVFTGTSAGIVAVLQTASMGSAIPDGARGFELQAIACVVLGGTRVTGGFGSIGRTLLGLATLAHLKISLRNLSYEDIYFPGTDWKIPFDVNTQLVIIGLLVILVAMANERVAGGRRE